MKKFQTLALLLTLLTITTARATLPDTGQVNSAYDRGDPALVAWAATIQDSERGLQDYQVPELGYAAYGSATDILGGGGTACSLGDGGWLVMGFDVPIIDGPGDDFVVFENGFEYNGVYMELGFVEVSSDGLSFARLPAFCRRVTQPGPWESSDPADFYNLAGNFTGGTGFDLNDLVLADDPLVGSGAVDLQDIRFLRVIDVVGDISGPGGSTDHLGRPVADPYPTPGVSSGMDLSGAAIINTGHSVRNEDTTWASVKSLYR